MQKPFCPHGVPSVYGMKLFDGLIIKVYSELPLHMAQLFITCRGLSHALELIFTQWYRSN